MRQAARERELRSRGGGGGGGEGTEEELEVSRRAWEVNYREAAIFLEEGQNNDKFIHHPRYYSFSCAKKHCFKHHLLQGQGRVASLLAGAQCLVQCHRSCHQPGCARARLRRGHQVRRRPSPNRRSLVRRTLCLAPPHHHALPQDQVGILMCQRLPCAGGSGGKV